jgi:DNA modification methylase
MTAPHYVDAAVTLWHGDSLDVLRGMPDASVDAVVTDPPYGLEFMGREWDRPWAVGMSTPGYSDAERLARPAFGDSRNANCRACGGRQRGARRCECPNPQWDRHPREDMRAFGAWCEVWAAECLRVLKPGGHLLAFGGTRTSHRLTCAIEDAGFEIRDTITWLYGSGFPKSLDVGKAIDKQRNEDLEPAAAVARFLVAAMDPKGLTRADINRGRVDEWANRTNYALTSRDGYRRDNPATVDAARWQGWGTALKPASEPVVVARKPLTGTVAATVTTYGTGALNIDACRVEAEGAHLDRWDKPQSTNISKGSQSYAPGNDHGQHTVDLSLYKPAGRWPANVVLTHPQSDDGGDACADGCVPGCPVADLDAQSGTVGAAAPVRGTEPSAAVEPGTITGARGRVPGAFHADEGGASRFFPTFRYQAKADTAQRPRALRPTCDCETMKPWQATSQLRDTDGSRSAADRSWNTSTSGNDTTAGPSPTDTTSTTATATSSTTTSPTSNSSRSSNTSAFTPGANSATANGGSPAVSAADSSLSPRNTSTSRPKAGPSTDDAASATSPRSSTTSVCGSCGAPKRYEAHATVKPLDLMRWLVRLVTPPGGLVLDPFAGSGTTAEACIVEGFRCITIEREADYLPLIVDRLTRRTDPVAHLTAKARRGEAVDLGLFADLEEGA